MPPERISARGRDVPEPDRRERLRRRLEATRWNAVIESMVLELVTVLTHKLKSPLTGLSLVASRLRRTGGRAGGDETLKGLADQIEAMTLRLSADVDRILEPLIGAGPPVDAVLLAREDAGRDDLEFALTAGKGVPPARGDVDFLLRALHDVLVNAGRIAAPPSRIEVATAVAEPGDVEIGVTVQNFPQGQPVETLLRPPESPPGFPLLVVPHILQRIGGQVRSFSASADVARVCFKLPQGLDGSSSAGRDGAAGPP
jgi:signal transduction histidine kinase